ncbi:MAG: hypothetical protein ACRCTW_07670 [Lactococcus garvieae]
MPGLTPTQEQLTGNYLGQDMRIYKPYSSYFSAVHSPFYAMTEKIHIEELMDELAFAGIVPRGSVMPTIKTDGHTRLSITPDIIGGFQPVTALEGIAKQSTIAIINGNPTDNTVLLMDQKVRRLKAATENTKNLLAGEVLLGSSITALGIDFDAKHESGFDPITPNTSAMDAKYDIKVGANDSLSFKLFEMIQDFWRTTGKVPTISVGHLALNKLMTEVNTSVGKREHGNYRVEAAGEKGFVVKADHMDMSIVTLAPSAVYSGKNDAPQGEDMVLDDVIMLHSDEALIWAYACLEYIDNDGNPGLMRGEVLVDEVIPDKMTARGGIFSKSAPFPVIIKNSLVQRYKLTIV